MLLSIIVAVSENGVIGAGNRLPWRLSGDLKRVKAITMGHHLIMGRKTYESIGRPLPGRTTVIISRSRDLTVPGCIVVGSLDKAIEASQSDSEAFVFGGGEIFRAALPVTDRIYFTRVHCRVEGDTHFPDPDPSLWKVIREEEFPADEKNEFPCTFTVFERRA
jgi:dihydrofolate reductase